MNKIILFREIRFTEAFLHGIATWWWWWGVAVWVRLCYDLGSEHRRVIPTEGPEDKLPTSQLFFRFIL